MHADDEHFLIIGTIEDADPPAFRQTAGRAPKKIVLQFFSTRLFETENLAALRIDARHHVLDGAVFASGVHGLKDEEDAPAILGVKHVLKLRQGVDADFQGLFGAGLVLGLEAVRILGIDVFEPEPGAIGDAIGFGKFTRDLDNLAQFHGLISAGSIFT